jgi:CBS domain-containing protein
MNVSEVMTKEVLSVQPTTPLHEVARLLVERGISGVPVLDDGRIVGVVSEADFINKQAHNRDSQGHLRDRLRDWLEGDETTRRARATVAGEAMSAPAIVIEPNASVSEAARTLEEHRINRLPVVEGDRLIGIITRADIVRSYVRDDSEIANDLKAALHAVEGISVAVEEGVASIVGTVRAPALADTIIRVAAAIPGVVAVDARELGWHDTEQPWFAGLSKAERDLLLTRA